VDHWVTVRKTGDIRIRRSGVPLPVVYSSISGALHIAHTDETGISGADEGTPTLDGAEVGLVVILPVLGNLGSLLVPK